EWVSASQDTFALMSGILSLVHPKQYAQGVQCMEKILGNSDLRQHAEQWACVFNAVSALANRETPFHRDGLGAFPWYDILLTVGRYTGGQLSLPALGIDLDYSPGTVVPLCGNILRHGVPHCEGERICLAYYMREAVHKWAGTGNAGWSGGPDAE
ncbi:hypothetical protein CONPUDRAFT_65475, partial [Coniophora puteana RWD-64-598 SS2]